MRRVGFAGRLSFPGIFLTILGLVGVPLPTPDYHVLRHLHRHGEVCPLHDHLLRWHPGVESRTVGAVFHWHWAPLSRARADGTAHPAGPSVHPDIPDPVASDRGDAPRLALGTGIRPCCWNDPSSPPPLTPSVMSTRAVNASALPHDRTSRSYGATFATRRSRAALLQRWVC